MKKGIKVLLAVSMALVMLCSCTTQKDSASTQKEKNSLTGESAAEVEKKPYYILKHLGYSNGDKYLVELNDQRLPVRICSGVEKELLTEIQYDENGNILLHKYFYPDCEITVEYNAQGDACKASLVNLSGESVSDYGPLHLTYTKREYTYDKDGNVTQKAEYNGEKMNYRDDYEYDQDGRLMTHNHTVYTPSTDGDVSYKCTYEYDAHGSLIREEKVYEENEYMNDYVTEYERIYDGDNCIQKISYTNGEKTGTDYMIYENNNLVEWKVCDGNDEVRYTEKYEYNINNRRILKKYYDSTGQSESETQYSYDRNNNLIQVKERRMSRRTYDWGEWEVTSYTYFDQPVELTPQQAKILQNGFGTPRVYYGESGFSLVSEVNAA